VKTPKRIKPLVDEGLVDEVMRQLTSGKEAEVYVVRCGQEIRCAKVYKEANKRSFRQNAQYTEGRKVKNSRRARAMEKGSRYGRQEQEQAWQNAEVDALHRLARAGVRVPRPHNFIEGVLLMELVTDEKGNAAPRLNDLELNEAQAREYHQALIREVVRMLCAGVIHGDLSEYNVLIGSDGPVIIDLPQAIDAAGNNSAGFMLERDVGNLTAYFGSIYQSGKLHPEVALTGCYARSEKLADVGGLMREIDDVKKEEAARQRYKQALKP
jgi:RIO kinase 1